MENNELVKITYELFYRDGRKILELSGEETDDLCDALRDIAENAINKYGWDKVFKSWEKYMREHCHTPEETISFIYWFFAYDGAQHKIPDLYDFLGFLYDKIDLNPFKYDIVEVIDAVTEGLLRTHGLVNGRCFDGYNYAPEKDPEIIKAVEKIRKARQENQ